MFMRYRGGGVGHLYMREVEEWLQETGWGQDILKVEEGPGDEVMEEDMPGSGEESEDEIMEKDMSGSGQESSSDAESSTRGDVEDIELEEQDSEEELFGDEETMEGENGYAVM
jgi:hypothetical protein